VINIELNDIYYIYLFYGYVKTQRSAYNGRKVNKSAMRKLLIALYRETTISINYWY